MNAGRQGQRSMTDSVAFYIIMLMVLTGIGLWVANTDLIRSAEGKAVQFSSVKIRPVRKKIPFILIAVDGDFTATHGCPAYTGKVAGKIIKSLKKLGINQIVTPGSITLTRPLASGLVFLRPQVLYWDTYTKRSQLMLSGNVPGSRPIRAMVDLQPRPAGKSVFIPTNNLLMGNSVPGLPYWLARQVKDVKVRKPVHRELIRFIGPSGTIPTLPLSRIVQGDFRTQDVGDRLAVLAVTSSACTRLLPTAVDPDGMSAGEVMVNAAITLTRPGPLRFSRLHYQAGIIFLLFLLALGMGRWHRPASPWMRAAIGVAISLFWTVAALVTAIYSGLILPVVVPVSGFFVVYSVFILVHHNRLARVVRTISARLSQVLGRVDRLAMNMADVGVDASMDQVMAAIKRAVAFEDAFVFVLPDKGRHLQFLWSMKSDESAIIERRRDIHRKGWLQVAADPLGAYLPRFFADHESSDAFAIPIREFDRINGALVLKLAKGLVLNHEQRQYLAATSTFLTPMLNGLRGKQRKMESSALSLMHPESIALAVHEQILRYKTAMDRLPLGVVVADPLGRVHYINSKALDFVRMIGFKGEIIDIYPVIQVLSRGSMYLPSRILQLSATENESISIPWTDPFSGHTKEITFQGLRIDLSNRTGSGAISNLLQVSIYEPDREIMQTGQGRAGHGFDMVSSITDCLSDMKKTAEHAGVSILAVLPPTQVLFQGDPLEFGQGFARILNALIQSTSRNDNLELHIRRKGDRNSIEVTRRHREQKSMAARGNGDLAPTNTDGLEINIENMKESGWSVSVEYTDQGTEIIQIVPPQVSRKS